MNPNWSDFEKWVFEKLERIDCRITDLENFKWRVAGGAAVISTLAVLALEFFTRR